MYHARHPQFTDRIACGEQPAPNQILIWTDDHQQVTCVKCARAHGRALADFNPDRYERRHLWVGRPARLSR